MPTELMHAATLLARAHALNADQLYRWAVRRCPDLLDRLVDEGPDLLPPDDRVLVAMLNDIGLDEAKARLEETPGDITPEEYMGMIL